MRHGPFHVLSLVLRNEAKDDKSSGDKDGHFMQFRA